MIDDIISCQPCRKNLGDISFFGFPMEFRRKAIGESSCGDVLSIKCLNQLGGFSTAEGNCVSTVYRCQIISTWLMNTKKILHISPSFSVEFLHFFWEFPVFAMPLRHPMSLSSRQRRAKSGTFSSRPCAVLYLRSTADG